MKPETQIKIGHRTAGVLFFMFLLGVLFSIPNTPKNEWFRYEPFVLTILPFVLAILLGCYFLAVGRRLLNLSLFIFVCTAVIFLYYSYIVYFIDYTHTFLFVIIIILLSQALFGMYREKRRDLVTEDEQKQ